ncbi:MAG: CPBP family intramembrane glutamic endopeptidase [Candidatus Acidiferrales bacterium]
MPANESVSVGAPDDSGKPKQIASWKHFLGFLFIMAGIAALGFHAQRAGTRSGGSEAAGQLADHGKAIYVYLVAGLMDWALLYYCWAGVHGYGGNLDTLSGGRWTSWKGLAADVAIALPFWGLWEGTGYAVNRLLGPSSAKSVSALLPRSLPEVLIWIAVSVTAGICEEIAFRGYLLRQLHALSGNVVAAVMAQALVFGVAHAYQGWKAVIVISIFGMLYGALAAWRRNVRATMIAHAWSDIWSGWLKAIIWR